MDAFNDHGADINFITKPQNILLHRYAMVGYTDVCKLLVKHGTKVNVKNDNGYAPLILASYFKIELIKFLIDHGADVNVASNDGYTALMWASEKHSANVLKVLLDHGADVNIKGKNGWTPLHLLAENGKDEVCEIFVKNGASLNAKDDTGWIPADHAITSGHKELAFKLLPQSNDVFIAARRGDLPFIKKNLKGAVSKKDEYGNIPLFFAAMCGNTEICKLLIEHGVNIKSTGNKWQNPDRFGKEKSYYDLAMKMQQWAKENN